MAQRNALRLTYDSCAVVGCERPFTWCEVHHPIPWSSGGPTDLANALPLCAWHHRRAHDARWRLRALNDDEWTFESTRAPWTDRLRDCDKLTFFDGRVPQQRRSRTEVAGMPSATADTG